MKCPGCGYLSFDRLEACKRCGAPLLAESRPAAPAKRVAKASPDLVAQQPLLWQAAQPEPAGSHAAGAPAQEHADFRVDDLYPGGSPEFESGQPEPEASPAFSLDASWGGEEPLPAFAADGADFVVDGWNSGVSVSPIIDREEDIPERFWAPEIVGLGRRAAAVLIDQALLAGTLGVFFLGAAGALRLSGFDTDYLYAPAGLQAALLPFVLLAALLSLVYHVYFHGRTGQTPGKALACVEVRTGEGLAPSPGRAAVRWFAAALGLACAGAGILWVLFEPRRRGWADLLSKTMLAQRRQEDPAEPDAR